MSDKLNDRLKIYYFSIKISKLIKVDLHKIM